MVRLGSRGRLHAELGALALVIVLTGASVGNGLLSAQPLPDLPGDTTVPTPPPGTLSLPEEIINQRVTSELLQLCGGPRCPQSTVVVRVPLEDETYAQALSKLEGEVLRQVQRSFQQDPNLQRLIVDGYIFRGPGNFVDTEFPVLTLFVSRHLWRQGTFSVAENGLRYPEGLRQLAAIAAPEVTPAPVVTPAEAPASELPPVPVPAEVPSPAPLNLPPLPQQSL